MNVFLIYSQCFQHVGVILELEYIHDNLKKIEIINVINRNRKSNAAIAEKKNKSLLKGLSHEN